MATPIEPVEIAGRRVGPGQPCFFIAEAGVNHNGSLELACRLVGVAAQAGADAVKFQTFRAAELVSPTAPKADYQCQTTGEEESQLQMLHRLELSESAHRDLMALARQQGVLFLSTPFEEASADFLESLGVAAFKVPSGEATNLPLLVHLARKGKPIILSTGMCTLEEVGQAVNAVQQTGNRQLVLLHCVSSYPANPAEANLRAMQTMAETFRLPVGFSDHSLGREVALAAVALGACVLEKHFTLDRSLPGPDHRASLEPHELQQLVSGIRNVEAALGDGRKRPQPGEANTAQVARKSLVAAQDIRKGSTLTEAMIAIRRPGTGLPPQARAALIGRTARADIPAGTLLTMELVS
jgi:N-acetylneuraminate synthase/N,N'-diacetyllegionaminate synthase